MLFRNSQVLKQVYRHLVGVRNQYNYIIHSSDSIVNSCHSSSSVLGQIIQKTIDEFTPIVLYSLLNSIGEGHRRSAGLRQLLQVVPSEAYSLPYVPCCRHCKAKRFYHETNGFCCADGTISLATNAVPDQLYDLFTSNTDESVHLRPMFGLIITSSRLHLLELNSIEIFADEIEEFISFELRDRSITISMI